MPKDKSSLSSRLRNYVRKFGENIFPTDGQIILCKFCEVRVSRDKRYSIRQRIKTEKHLKSVMSHNILLNNCTGVVLTAV